MMPENFGEQRVLVVGDVMLDRYWDGPTQRISPEAPVPIVKVSGRSERPGGAANVAANLASLGVPVTLLGWIGRDEAGETLAAALRDLGVDCRLLVNPAGCTIVKLRVTSLRQQILRLDFEDQKPAPDPVIFSGAFDELVAAHDVVVFSDYGKGALADVAQLIARANQLRRLVIVDPKGQDFTRYRGAAVITPNESEFTAVVGAPADEADFEQRAGRLRVEAGIENILVTRGGRGMSLFASGEAARHFPAQTLEVFDVTGAGDTVVATLAAGLAAGLSLPEAARLSNHAAGIVVGRRGSASVTRGDLFDPSDADSELPSEEHTLQLVEQARRRGERIVMTNGCFDILHLGHVDYLRRAKALGHRLLVAINSDASVTRLKGPERPVNPLAHRAAILASLRSVDWVIPFDGSKDETGNHRDTPLRLIKKVAPDILVKGGDYLMDEIVGAAEVLAAGGEVRILPFVPGLSTTKLISRIGDARN